MFLELSKRKIEILDAEKQELDESIALSKALPSNHQAHYAVIDEGDCVTPQADLAEQLAQTLSSASEGYYQPTQSHYDYNDVNMSPRKAEQLHYLAGYEQIIHRISNALWTQNHKSYALANSDPKAIAEAPLAPTEVAHLFRDIANKISLFSLRAVMETNQKYDTQGTYTNLSAELNALANYTLDIAHKLSTTLSQTQFGLQNAAFSVLEQQRLQDIYDNLPREYVFYPHNSETHLTQNDQETFSNQLQCSLQDMQSALRKMS
ncbi:MAG: hypothetical protein AAF228_05320 [Pseudomonadota bacterium]